MKANPLTAEQVAKMQVAKMQAAKMQAAVASWNARMNIRTLSADEQAKQKQASDALMIQHVERFPRMHD